MSTSVETAGNLAIMQGQSTLASRFSKVESASKVSKAASDFENMFMSQMLQPMFDTVGVNKLFGGGHGEEMMRGFLVQEYGKVMAGKTGLGIAQAVQAQLERTQAKAAANLATQNNGATNVTGQVQ